MQPPILKKPSGSPSIMLATATTAIRAKAKTPAGVLAVMYAIYCAVLAVVLGTAFVLMRYNGVEGLGWPTTE
jgi:hypothetical protein